MKYYFFVLLMVVAAFVACKKTAGTTSKILLLNATYSIPALTAELNGIAITNTALSQGQVSGTADAPYQNFPAGTNSIVLKSGNSVLADKNLYTGPVNGYSILVYDTSQAAGDAKNILILTDDLTIADTASIRFRFINCVPDTLLADIWLVNTNGVDSGFLINNAPFIGASAIAGSVQTFNAIKYHGQSYHVKIKKAGTQELLAAVNNYLFNEREIYSFVYSGLPTGSGATARKLLIVHHALK
jgi:Domain of unknown function (DUF4397)